MTLFQTALDKLHASYPQVRDNENDFCPVCGRYCEYVAYFGLHGVCSPECKRALSEGGGA